MTESGCSRRRKDAHDRSSFSSLFILLLGTYWPVFSTRKQENRRRTEIFCDVSKILLETNSWLEKKREVGCRDKKILFHHIIRIKPKVITRTTLLEVTCLDGKRRSSIQSKNLDRNHSQKSEPPEHPKALLNAKLSFLRFFS